MNRSERQLLPGSWIGVIGGGQLGRMLAMEARRMSYHVCVLDPDPRCPAGQIADDQVIAPYSDCAAARELACRVDVVTYEFENVNAESVAAAEDAQVVLPGSHVLRIAQHRIREKEMLSSSGFPVPNYLPVDTISDLEAAISAVSFPAVMKTATSGYDGKGQEIVNNLWEARQAFDQLRPSSEMLILEEYIPLQKELSVICARNNSGESVCFPTVENIHCNGILDMTIAPARVPVAVAKEAEEWASAIAEKLELVGLLAVEIFLTRDNTLLVNELAPRPHNSGHHTLDACAVSQFEQLLRVLCGLPLGAAELISPAVMANLLGDLWPQPTQPGGSPDWAGAMSIPGVKLHLYGKAVARPRRKMGHLTAVAPTVELALGRAIAARELAARSKGRYDANQK